MGIPRTHLIGVGPLAHSTVYWQRLSKRHVPSKQAELFPSHVIYSFFLIVDPID